MTRDFERELKETFMRHETDVKPREDAWVEIEGGVKRAHARRYAAMSGVLAVVIAAAVLALPRIVGSGDEPRLIDPAVSDTPTPTGIDTSDWVARAGVQAGFALKIPSDWRGGWFEAHWDFHPEDLPGLPEGGDTFAVDIHSAVLTDEFWEDRTRERSTTDVSINGKPFKRRETTDRGPKIVEYVGEWGGEKDTYLIVQLIGSTDELWDRYIETAETIVRTVRPYDGSTPVHGTLDPATPVDEYTKALVRFMDARVEGIGADEMLCCNAAGRDQESLYRYGNQPMMQWSDAGGASRGAGTVAFNVSIVWGDDRETTDGGELVTTGYESGKPAEGEPVKVLDFVEQGDGP